VDRVDDKEMLARFICSRKHFSPDNNRVKQNAFLPDNDSTTSVTRHDGLNEVEIWQAGEVARGDRTLYARGDVQAFVARCTDLDVEPHEPPPHHAHIVRWCEDKSANKLKAQHLADAATLVINPNRDNTQNA